MGTGRRDRTDTKGNRARGWRGPLTEKMSQYLLYGDRKSHSKQVKRLRNRSRTRSLN